MYLKDGRPDSVYENLRALTWDLTEGVTSSKSVYYEWLANKLNDPNTSGRAYWSTMKTLFNSKKVPVIPTTVVNNKLVTNFKDKANIFNDFLSKQCHPMPNNSTLPSIQSFETSSSEEKIKINTGFEF